MSDTPETDDLARGNHVVPTEWAQQLERERDEAREALRQWQTLCLWGGTPKHIHDFIKGQQTRIWHLECERDEARAAFVIATDQMVQSQCKLRETDKERQAFVIAQQEVITNLILELAEANELLASEKITRNYIIKRSVEVERERDEARQEVKLLKAILDLIKKDLS